MTTLPELSRRVSEASGPSRELDAATFRLGILSAELALVQMTGFYSAGPFGRLAFPGTRERLDKNIDDTAAALLAIHERKTDGHR